VKNSDGEIYESEDEIEIEDEDPDALSRPAAASSSAVGRGLDCMVRYDAVYSTSYQVPVLYLTFADASTSKHIPLPSADEVYDMLVPQGFKASMRDVGVMGALSMAEHPITGMPAYFVHPCRTQEALTPLLAGASQTAGTEPAVEYLLLWFGVIGASVGLSVPVHTASLIAERRGEATELGRC
jgi:ubiquitin-like-conjugating enzyme ATG10